MDPVTIIIVALMLVASFFIGILWGRTGSFNHDNGQINMIERRRLKTRSNLDAVDKMIARFVELVNGSEPNFDLNSLGSYKRWQQMMTGNRRNFESLERDLMSHLSVKHYSQLEKKYQEIEEELDGMMTIIGPRIVFLEELKETKSMAELLSALHT